MYGNGENIRGGYVIDRIKAIDLIFHSGNLGETYNIGGSNEWKNIDLINIIIKITDKFLKRKPGESVNLITNIKDRPGHDFRYALNSDKLINELGWKICENLSKI